MPPRRPAPSTLLASVPSTPGVYLFYGPQEELLYVGKSKTLKARVRAHFRDRSERMMMSRVRRIETRETAGELGALLLESRLIKELKPMFNVAQRQRRRIVIAERRTTPQGYTTVHLRSVDAVDPRKSAGILGVFKHTTQAKEFLETAVKERRLCPVLLGIEQGRASGGSHLRPCFSYHLGRCSGACIGEEPPGAFNARVEAAFEERRIVAWPYGGPLVIREQRNEKGPRSRGMREEMFLVDNWVLVGSLTRSGDELEPFGPGTHRFDYDTYKLILSFVLSERNGLTTRVVSAAEWKRYLRAASGPILDAPPRSV